MTGALNGLGGLPLNPRPSDWAKSPPPRGCTGGPLCLYGASEITFPYRFARVQAVAHCHERCRNGKPGARWGRHRGAGLLSRSTTTRRPACNGASVRFRSDRPGGTSLGTGGAVASHFANPRVSEVGGVDCQVPSRWMCLSQRGGAAGPERSPAPGPCTLALGQRLEQLTTRAFCTFHGTRNALAERPITLHLGSARRFRATPFSFGTRPPHAGPSDSTHTALDRRGLRQ